MAETSEWEPVGATSDWEPVASSGDWEAVSGPATTTATASHGPTIQELRAGGVLAPLTENAVAEPRDPSKVPLRTTIGGEPQPAFTYNTTPEERQEKFKRELLAPIIPIPKFTINPDDSKTAAVGKSIVNFLSGMVEFAESPAGILTAPVAGVAPKAVATFFTVDMAKSLGEQATAAGMDWDTMTDAQKAAAVTDMSATGLLATSLGSGVGVKVARDARVGWETAQKFLDTKAPIKPGFDMAAFDELNKVAPLTAAEVAKPVELPSSAKPKEADTAAEPSTNTPVSEGQVPPPPVEAAKPEEAQPIGMGGAVPSEFEQSAQTATSIKNATVDVERSKRGLPPAMQPQRRKWGTVWDEAMAKIDNDPGYPDRLLTELRDKPRALNDLEDATLLHRQIDLQNEHGKATRDLAQAFDDGRVEAVANEKARVNAISDQLLDLYNINKSAGTATGRGLAARKMLAYEDFTLAKMELEKRAANDGAPLSDVQREEVNRLNKRIEDTQKAFDDYVTKTEAANAERAIADALAEVERGAAKEPAVEPHVRIIADKIKVYFDNRADAALKRLQGKLFTISPQVLADLTDLGVSRILGGAASFTGWSAKMVEVLGEKIKPHLQTVWESSQRALTEHVEKVAGPQKEKVKRAATGATINEQVANTKTAITEKVNSGQRSDISALAQRLARLLVEQGITERDPLIDAVHGALKEADPEFTRREAMDAISGYGDFKQLSKDEISKQLRDLKGQMQQVGKLEDMQAGKPPLKTGIERRIPSQEESRLIKLVNDAKNKFQIPIDDPNTQLKSSLDTLKTRLRNRTAELKDKLKRGDFEKKPRRIIQMDAEANRLSFEAAQAKSEWHEALMRDRLAKRSVPQKILAGAGEVLNTSRAVITSADFSAVLRQGGFIALAHPVRAAKSLPAMFRAFRSQAGQHAVNQEIIARKNYPLYQQGKLYLSEHGQKLSQMEEAYMSRWADKIPLVAGSQRAYVTFLNKLRADSFDAMANSLARSGELTPVEVNAIANFINVATGRGNLGMKENALVGLNTVFFAPRYVASRFQLLAGQPLYRGSARTRKAVATEYARFMIGVAVIYGLAALDGAEIEKDPRSSDFGKLKYGNTRLDPMAGLLQNTVLLSRLTTGETKTLKKGEIVPIRGDKAAFGGTSFDVLSRFLRTKLSPAFGTGVNLLVGRDVVGNPVTAASTAENLLVPLGMRDILNVMVEQGVPRGTAMGILSIFGWGLQNFDVNKPKSDSPK